MFPCEDSNTVSVCLSVRPSVHLSVPREKKSPWLRQYQSYISNWIIWYINGKIFTCTTTWKHKNLIFFLIQNWISTCILFDLFSFLSSKLNFDLYLDLFQRNEIIQVGLNKHLYDDIGDASSSLRGSTSSFWLNWVIMCFRILYIHDEANYLFVNLIA